MASETNPRSFSIVGKNLKLNTAEDIQPILDDLDKVENLEEVHFGGNTLGVEASKALAKNLEQKKTLKVADFADIFTGRLISEIPDALRALCDALVDHESLVEINLSDNAFGGRSAEPMVNFLTNNHHFQVLKLNNNGLGITGGTIVAKALIEAAEKIQSEGKASNLRTVICGRNRLENGSAPVWAEAFQKHGGLQEVRMFQNGIRMEGIEAISKGLSHCKNLQVLDLQDNTATVKGSRAIAAALPSWPELKTLNLSDMLLKPKGGQLVLGAIAKGTNTNLETLQIQYDDIDRKGLALLGPAISRHLSKLTKLEINGNWADEDDDCINDIKKALEAHGNEDALDELDEMDPEGEESEAEEDEEEEKGEQEEEEEKKEEGTAPVAAEDDVKEKRKSFAEVAAASAATATAVPVAAAAATSDSSEAKKDVKAEEPAAAEAESKAVEPAAVSEATDAAIAEPEIKAADPAVTADEPATTIVGGPSGATATSVASELPESEPVIPVAASPAVAAAAVPASSADAPTSNATSGVTDEIVDNAKAAESEKPAEVAAEVSKSVEAVPEPSADVAAEVSASAQAVPERSEQIEQTEEVAASAEAVHAQDEKANMSDNAASEVPASKSADVDEVTNKLAATDISNDTPAPAAKKGHGASGSVDLSQELYPADAQAGSSSQPQQQQSRPEIPPKKNSFKAAFGAIKELLFR
ncbi:unnamed protein product [Sympodiomycopsis kandeliae]